MADKKTETKESPKTDKVVGKTPPNISDDMDTRTMSSVGAELDPEVARVEKVDGKVALDAGGPYAAAAPRPTPAEAVLYPATGGLPDTGPSSKYVLGENRGPKLYDEDGNRVNRDGDLIDENFDVIPDKTAGRATKPDPKHKVSSLTRQEMEAGQRALGRR